MTVSAPIRLNPLRGFRPATFTRRKPAARREAVQHILRVEFTSPDGRTWPAIGGGDTLADALAFAQDSCPTGATWQPVSWSDLYGG